MVANIVCFARQIIIIGYWAGLSRMLESVAHPVACLPWELEVACSSPSPDRAKLMITVWELKIPFTSPLPDWTNSWFQWQAEDGIIMAWHYNADRAWHIFSVPVRFCIQVFYVFWGTYSIHLCIYYQCSHKRLTGLIYYQIVAISYVSPLLCLSDSH